MDNSRERLSIEAAIVGRNDQYEPNWEENLFSVIAYNRTRFDAIGIDFRVGFVEWNPLPERPLLATRLVERFPFVRGIVVEPAVHEALSTNRELNMVLTHAFNAAFRTTGADFCLGTCGDILLGSQLIERIAREGLRERCLYRAERANIRNDLDFTSALPATIEAPENFLHVDTCTEPPFDKPPYTNSGGDFSMLDAGTMTGVRGYDESITFARMHIDARLGWTSMSACDECVLLGRIYHISHAHSHSSDTAKKVSGRLYNYMTKLPYLNDDNWGVAKFDWQAAGDRLFRVGLGDGRVNPPPNNLSPSARKLAEETRAHLVNVRASQPPEEPSGEIRIEANLFAPGIAVAPPAKVEARGDALSFQTAPTQFSISFVLQLPKFAMDSSRLYWVRLEVAIDSGALNAGITKDFTNYACERFASVEDGLAKVYLPVGSSEGGHVVLRNPLDQYVSCGEIFSAQLISQAKVTSDAIERVAAV